MTNKQKESGFLSFIIGAYGISVVVFAFYFNWLYAKTNGFISWLLFGEIIATLKALIWPIFIFFVK